MKKQLSYIDSVHRSGTIWNISVMILLLAFPLTVAALFGAAPDWGALVVGLIATAPMYWAVGPCWARAAPTSALSPATSPT